MSDGCCRAGETHRASQRVVENRGGDGYAWTTPPPTGTGFWVGEGLSVGRISGWVMTNSDGSANSDSIGCGVEAFLTSGQ